MSDAVSSAFDSIGNVVSGVGNAVGNIVQTVANNPLDAAALAAGGYYFAPELGAWIGSDGTALAGTADGVAAGTAPTTADALSNAGIMNAATGAGTEAVSSAAAVPSATELSALGAIPTTAAAGAAGGSTLASMLPYMAGGQIATGLLQSQAAKQAADVQSAAAQGATQLQGQMFNTINQQQAPYRTAGYQGLNQINALGSGPYVQYDAAGNPVGTAQGSGYLTHQFNAQDLAAGLAPNYDFMLQQGQMANQRAANAAGGGFSGNALQGLNKFTQDYAGNAYQQAFNNYQTQRSNIYNTLAGIAGIGQTGQTATNTAQQNATNAASQLGVGSAAAQAAGITGQSNALANTVGNVGNTYLLASLLGQKGSITP